MAGGEGTRLRPMTANQPKPLLPVVNKPIMEHVLLLLKRHGFTETVVTVQFLASLVRNYFGDGEDVGMSLQYATEEMPLGTAGSVKNAEDELRADPFLVISGDALTDIDLSALVRYHKENGALVTVALTRVPNPLEFGIIIVDEDGRIQRFLEKPTWGQVFSDTVNTGIYVMEPEVLAEVPAGVPVDWSGDVFPQLLKSGAPLYGWIADGYWEDVGTHESYLKAQADVLSGRVEAEIDGFEMSPGVWVSEGAEVDPEALLSGPLCIGDYAKIEAGAQLREFTVVGSNVVVKEGAFLHRAVVHNNVYVGQGDDPARLCHRQEHRRDGLGPDRGGRGRRGRVRDRAGGIRVGRGEGLPVQDHRGGRGGEHQRHLGVARAAHAVRPAGGVRPDQRGDHPRALRPARQRLRHHPEKGAMVTTSRDVSRAARALKRAVQGALNASAIDVVDLEAQPLPVARFRTARSEASGGIALRTTPGDPQSIDIIFLDERGADLSQAAGRKLERVFSRQEYRRAFPGEIAELSYPPRVVESYASELLRMRRHDRRPGGGPQGGGRLRRRHRVAGAAGTAGPDRRRGAHVNNRLDEGSPTQSLAQVRAGMQRLSELVASSRADFGVRFDQVGERIQLVDDKGAMVSDDRALLVVLDLIAAERRSGRVALPVTTTRVAERVCRFHGVQVSWTPTSQHGLTEADRGRRHDLRGGRAGRVRGARVQPEPRRHRGVRAAARPGRPHPADPQPDRRPDPPGPSAQALDADPVGGEGQCHAHGDGGRRRPGGGHHRRGAGSIEPDGGWVLVLPDPADAITHLWAEGADADAAQDLLDAGQTWWNRRGTGLSGTGRIPSRS